VTATTSKYIFLIILLVQTTIPFFFGSVQPWIWPFYSLAIFAAFILLYAGWNKNIAGFSSPPIAAAFGVFFLLVLLQIIPLPQGLLQHLAPRQHQIFQDSLHLLDFPQTAYALSYQPAATAARGLWLLSLVLLFIVLCTVLNRSRMKLLLWLLFAIASLEALYGIVQALVPNLGVLWVDSVRESLGNARGTYINRNHFAGYMEMMIPLMLGFILAREDWSSKIGFKAFIASDRPHLQFLLSLGLVLMVLSLLFSKSRAGISGFLVGLMFFLYLIRSGRKSMPMSAKITFLVVITLVVFYGIKIGFDPIFDRFLQISPEASRLDFWRDSLPIIASHPLGTGLGTFEQVFAVHNVSTVADLRITHLHNDYLQLLLETGWIGFTALVGVFGWFLAASFRRIRRMRIAQDPFRFFAAAGAFSGLVSMALHSFFDFNLQIPANCLYFATLLAVLRICTAPPGLTPIRYTAPAGFTP